MSLPVSATNPYTTYLDKLHDGMFISVLYGLALIPQYRTGRESSNNDNQVNFQTGRRASLAWEQQMKQPTPISAFRRQSSYSFAQRNSRKQQFWIARRVDGYITMNLHFLVPFGGFISCAGMLTYVYSSYIVMWQGRMLCAYNTYRSFLWIPLVMHGYLVTAASVQAWVVVASKSSRMSRGAARFNSPKPQSNKTWWKAFSLNTTTTVSNLATTNVDDKTRQRQQRKRSWMSYVHVPGPRVFNGLFIGCTIVLLGAMLGSDIAFAVSWNKLWKSIVELETLLKQYEQDWTGGFEAVKFLQMSQAYENLTNQVKDNVPYKNAVVLSLIVCAYLVALFNLGSISLLLLLRKQIRAAIKRRARTKQLFPLPPPPLTFYGQTTKSNSMNKPQVGDRDVTTSPFMNQINNGQQAPIINVTFPSRPRPTTSKRLSFGFLSKEDIDNSSSPLNEPPPSSTLSEKLNFKSSPFVDAVPTPPPPSTFLTRSSLGGSGGMATPGLANRKFSLSSHLPSLPKLPRKTSAFTIKTNWTSTTDNTIKTSNPLEGSSGILSPFNHSNVKTPLGNESNYLMYSPASPSMAIDLGGRSSLNDLKRAERDLEICVSIVVSMALMFGSENVWNYLIVLKQTVSWPLIKKDKKRLNQFNNNNHENSNGSIGGGGGGVYQNRFVGGSGFNTMGQEIGIETFVGGILNDQEEEEEEQQQQQQHNGLHTNNVNETLGLEGMGIDGVEFSDCLRVHQTYQSLQNSCQQDQIDDVDYFSSAGPLSAVLSTTGLENSTVIEQDELDDDDDIV
ncbi:hypothetical protein OIO90_006392 [Microbotryomycetes sp. JL221]|nr:hypothetical protein OIO90_006392 [Microbotryomycetes sp. JL221]